MSKTDHREQYAHFAATIRKARKDAGLTQTIVAKRLGHPQSFVAKYEGCGRRLDPVEFLHIAKALESDWEKLLKDTAEII